MYRLAEIMMKGIHGLSPARTSMAMGIVLFCACTFLKRGERMYYSYDLILLPESEQTERLTVLKRRLLVKIILKKMKILFIYEDLKRN